jgi:hypothetical protein
MISYELAKQLQDAGWPEGGKGSWAVPPDKIVLRSGDRAYVPTLSELIEACEREGYFNFELVHFRKGWMAKIIENATNKTLDQATLISEGASPELAVARLWLALHAV